jgi:hypothetical protein
MKKLFGVLVFAYALASIPSYIISETSLNVRFHFHNLSITTISPSTPIETLKHLIFKTAKTHGISTIPSPNAMHLSYKGQTLSKGTISSNQVDPTEPLFLLPKAPEF